MNNTPTWLKKKWSENPAKRCERWSENECSGRLTKEYALYYAGKQIQEDWAVIDLCWHHHLGKGLSHKRTAIIQEIKSNGGNTW